MRAEEVDAVGAIAAEVFAGGTEQIHEFHGGIAERVFGAVGAGIGPAAAPVRLLHDGIAGLAYAATGLIGSGAVKAAAQVASRTRRADAPPIDGSRRGRVAIGALNGAFGDALTQRGSALATAMTVRVRGRAVALRAAELGTAFPDAGPRVAVFLHGLCETEDAWRIHASQSPTYAARLHDELGYTPVELRYNSGRHISENGRDLVELLDELIEAWPVEIEEIALIGHSMGALVARSACHYGAGSGAIDRVRHVFALGSPHHGARLARAAHAAGAALHRLPETRALATALRVRSVGIQDLHHGYLVDEDWHDYDPEAFLVHAAREIPFLPTANHYFIAATLTRDPQAPLGRAFGDLLVSRPSAWAQRRNERLRFDLDNYRSVGGANHFDLLGHPAIADQLVAWLGRPALAPGNRPLGDSPN